MNSSEALLLTTADIVEQRPSSVKPVLKLYYTALTRLAEGHWVHSSEDHDHVLCKAVVAPLTSPTNSGKFIYMSYSCASLILTNTLSGMLDLTAYHTLAYTFLTSPKLDLLERNPRSLAHVLDVRALSESIVQAFSDPRFPCHATRDELLWLLAHFVALNRAAPVSRGSKYLEALHLQMSFLAVDIRLRSTPPQEENEEFSSDPDEDTEIQDFTPLPEYVVSQLEFLVNDDGITDLLSRFAS